MKIVAGKIKKELKEVLLGDSNKDDLSVGQYVEKCAKEISKGYEGCTSMLKFEVGEGIEEEGR